MQGCGTIVRFPVASGRVAIITGASLPTVSHLGLVSSKLEATRLFKAQVARSPLDPVVRETVSRFSLVRGPGKGQD
jgi:hypothetical protein